MLCAPKPNTVSQVCKFTHMIDTEGVFELLNYHEQDLTLNHIVEIWKQSAAEEAKNADEPEPEPKERTMAYLSLTWGLGLIDLAFRYENIYSSEQWAATSREECMRMLVCYEEIVTAKKRSVSY